MMGRSLRKFAAFLAIAFAAATGFAQTAASAPQTSHPAQKSGKASASIAANWHTQKCAGSVTLRLASLEPRQGSLQVMEIASAIPLSQADAAWNGNTIPFWRVTNPAQKGVETWRGLLGIDLEQKTGSFELAVSAQAAGGAPVACSASLTVRSGQFKTESLSVAPQFVEPNPEQVAQAKKDSERIHEIYANPTPEKLWTGLFRLPLGAEFHGRNFGVRRVLNGEASSPHTGVDFPAPTGTPVRASQRGRVMLPDLLYFSGNTVIIDHGLGLYTFYCHLSAIDVKAGEMVAAGALIGKVGATGRVTGPHLHWALNVNHARVNSVEILRVR
jgi:murein DD-endopeptidase MepM/ murein hydrolase activator NlpD